MTVTDTAKDGSEKSVLDMDNNEKRYSVGGKTLILRPLSIKRFRQLSFIIDDGLKQFSDVNSDTIVKDMVEILASKGIEIMSILFQEIDHPFMTKDFIENNFTVPLSRNILEDAMTMNGVKEFLPNVKKSMQPSKETD